VYHVLPRTGVLTFPWLYVYHPEYIRCHLSCTYHVQYTEPHKYQIRKNLYARIQKILHAKHRCVYRQTYTFPIILYGILHTKHLFVCMSVWYKHPSLRTQLVLHVNVCVLCYDNYSTFPEEYPALLT
jgi:hypothetical protein